MKETSEGQLEQDKPARFVSTVPGRKAGTAGLLACVLVFTAAGCQGPQADVSSTAARLRTSVTKRAATPAPQPPGVLTVDRAIAEALAASPQLAQMASRVAAATVEGLLQSEVAWQRAEAGYAAAAYDAKVARAMLRRALGQFADE